MKICLHIEVCPDIYTYVLGPAYVLGVVSARLLFCKTITYNTRFLFFCTNKCALHPHNHSR